MRKVVVSNIETETLYGISVIHNLITGEYYTFLGDNKITANSRSDIAYKINCLQAYPSGI